MTEAERNCFVEKRAELIRRLSQRYEGQLNKANGLAEAVRDGDSVRAFEILKKIYL